MVASAEITVEFFKGKKSVGKHDIADFGEIEELVAKNKLDYTYFVYTSSSSMEEKKKDEDGNERSMVRQENTVITETKLGFEAIMINVRAQEDAAKVEALANAEEVEQETPLKSVK
jgi:hypothetical protein